MKKMERALLILLSTIPVLVLCYRVNPGSTTSLGEAQTPRSDYGDSVQAPFLAAIHGDTSIPDDVLLKKYGNKVPIEIMLAALAKKMPPVLYRHKLHLDKKVARCGNCHHVNPNDIKPCATCHTAAPPDPKIPKYDKAYHDLCVGCHKTRQTTNGQGQTSGPPIKCNDCHKKENKKPGT